MCLADNGSGVCIIYIILVDNSGVCIIYIYTSGLGEEYVCGCPGRLARGMFSAVIICVMDYFILFKSSLFIIIVIIIISLTLNAFDIALVFVLLFY